MAKYRSLFISDVHIGIERTNLSNLLTVLRENEFEYIYLVGDIIDGWKLKRKFTWGKNENTFLQKILRLSRKGVKIVYLIGNHDEFLYNFENQNFGDIEIKEHYIHTTLKNENILLLHGHQFDGVIKCNKWLQKIGSWMYEMLLEINQVFNTIRRKLGYDYWSLSAFLKAKAKEAVNYISDFEGTLITYAEKYPVKVDSVLCGHIHTPKIKIGNINYYNTGDFVEHTSFIVETLEGNIELKNEK